MLRELWIENLALAERLRLEFGPGLTALTGETGAGKSLVVGALDLALGARASGDLVRRGADEARVSARFDPVPDDLEDEPGEGLLLTRVIPAAGASRAYVNDRPASARRLRELGRRLAELHGQHEQQAVLREDVQLDLVDAHGGLGRARDAVAGAHEAARAALRRRDEFRERTRRAAEEREILAYQLRELEDADLRPGEEEELERERKRAAHAGRLAESVERAVEALEGDEDGAARALGAATDALTRASDIDESLRPLLRALEEAGVAVEETVRDLQRYADDVELDPERRDAVEARLDRLASLKRKFRTDHAGLVERRDELARTARLLEDEEGSLAALEAGVAEALQRLGDAASTLGSGRTRAGARLARAVDRELRGLGMAAARFRVEFPAADDGLDLPGGGRVGARGAEGARFLLAANAGEDGGPLSRVASGGETSRVMLALRNVLAEADPTATVVFDEIDAGIGGVVADAVGARLAAVARRRQVFTVTHLAVIASRADRHWVLRKETRDGRTLLSAAPVAGVDRERELARMMAGEAGGEDALAAARTLLQRDASGA